MMSTARRTERGLSHPLLNALEMSPVTTALAPDIEAPDHLVTDGAPGARGLTLLAPPGPVGLAQALPAPGAAGVHRGGLLVLGVD